MSCKIRRIIILLCATVFYRRWGRGKTDMNCESIGIDKHIS